jgi:hypothetical protein
MDSVTSHWFNGHIHQIMQKVEEAASQEKSHHESKAGSYYPWRVGAYCQWGKCTTPDKQVKRTNLPHRQSLGGHQTSLCESQKEDLARLRLPTTLPSSPYQQGGRLGSD